MADKHSIIQTSTVNSPTVQTTAAVLGSNPPDPSTGKPGRVAFMIQNQDTHALNICIGGTASSTIYHVVLKACSIAADGTGGTIAMEGPVVSTLAITCYAQGGGNPSYTVLEI